jgi:hypothetical protein
MRIRTRRNATKEPLRSRGATPEDETSGIFERPDGYYWQSKAGDREYGPFPTLMAALEDQGLAEPPADDEEPLEVAESLEEAESEVGISGWIDPDSGELAEEERPRIEEH